MFEKDLLKNNVDLIINLQGDMPNIKSKSISRLEKLMRSNDCDIGTLASYIVDNNEIANTNIVKVEIDEQKKTGYFSYNSSVIDLSTIEKAIAKLGYSANNTKADPEAFEALAACCQIGSK